MDFDLIARTSSLLLGALAVTRLLARAAAATRHLIWHTAVLAVLLAPAITAVLPRFTVTPLSWLSVPTELPPVIWSASEMPAAAESRSHEPGQREAPATWSAIASAETLARAGAWLVGAWFLIGWLASGAQAWRSGEAPREWVGDARRLAARMGFTRLPPIRQARDAGSPRVAGLFRAVILVPRTAREWTATAREAALVHELSHIQRADRRTQALAQLVCALYWFNPLAWIAARALARERERACDDEVLRAGVRPSTYATLLLDLAKSRPSWSAAAALGMARPSTIEGRLLAILAAEDAAPATSPSRRGLGARGVSRWLVLTASFLVVAAVLGAQQAQPALAGSGAAELDGATVPIPMDLIERDEAAPVTKALTRALDDPDQQVREQAALGLAFVPGRQTIDPLLKALTDSDAQVREKAAIGLAFRRDPRVIDALLTAMHDSDAQVREKVAIALGASGDGRAVDALETALADPDRQVREKAASGLVLLGLSRW